MIVVADTSPINYLLLIQEIDVLPKMYGRVVIPRAVQHELQQPVAPGVVRTWIKAAPSWLEIRTPRDTPDASLAKLDPGERAEYPGDRNARSVEGSRCTRAARSTGRG